MNAISSVVSYKNVRSESTLHSMVGNYRSFAQAKAANPTTFEREFAEAVFNWTIETAIFSNPQRLIENIHFKNIVAMGDRAIPLIITEIMANPSLLSEALREITGEYPVSESSFGDLEAMASDWLNWWNMQDHAA